jgi:ADP-heptose:LPS heptosyltransferase
MLSKLFPHSLLPFGRTHLPTELANPRRILVTHFGDAASAVQSVPVFVALRNRFPYADIAWLIGEDVAPLVLDHWAVNRFIIVKQDWSKRLSEVRRIRKRLQSFAPMVAIDLQNSFGSALATWLSKAKYRIGFGGKQRRSLHNVRVVATEPHRIERNLRLLQPFGIFGTDIGFDMPECEKDRTAARNILHRKGLYGNFAMLYVSAENPSARWHEEQYGIVAKYLLEQWNLPSLIVWSGDESELQRAETAVHAAGGAALQAPWTTLVGRKALSKLATIFVGSESAELQIAAAVETRCVGLFGPAPALENTPFGREHRTVQVQPQHVRRRRKRTMLSDWITAISPELVCEKCDEVLTELLQPNIVPIRAARQDQKKAA